MKDKIHPQLSKVTIKCACGNAIETMSTKTQGYNVEICSSCHPFFTGKHKMIDSAGKVDQFQKKYANWNKGKAAKADPKASN